MPSMRVKLTAIITVLVASCVDAPTSGPIETRQGVYSEFLDYGEVATTLDVLAESETSLTLAVPEDRIGEADLAQLLRRSAAARVDLRLWLVVDREDGYWPNEGNMALFADAVTRLLGWLDSEQLTAGAIVYDMEPALPYSEEMRALEAPTPAALAAVMAPHLDPAAFDEARALLIESVLEVQASGLRAVCVTYPQVIDDMIDGDTDMQDALDIPVDGVPFDEVGFMVYQTTFAETVGSWIGPSLVSEYAEDGIMYFGDRAVIALGVVGTAGIFDHEFGYESPSILGADIEAAHDRGIERIELYSLDGILEQGDVEAWLTASPPADEVPDSSVTASLVRSIAQGLDAMLDDERP